MRLGGVGGPGEWTTLKWTGQGWTADRLCSEGEVPSEREVTDHYRLFCATSNHGRK